MSEMATPLNVLMGKTEEHIVTLHDGIRLHREVVAPFQALAAAARKDGIDLRIASGFRDYQRQRAIWNAKACGDRPVLDAKGNCVDCESHEGWQLAQLIMRWSAVPGLSRHHWGTDIDVYDHAAKPADYQLRLTPEEYSADGMFGHLSEWLSEQIASEASFGFVRPYVEDRGGIAPEPWHLSYAPVAAAYEQQLLLKRPQELFGDVDLLLGDCLQSHADMILAKYVRTV